VVVAAFAASITLVLPPATISDPPANQIGGEFGHPIEFVFRPAVDDRYVVAFRITGFCEALTKRAQPVAHRLGRPYVEQPDRRHCRLLPACRERPRGCQTSNHLDEIASSHTAQSLGKS
jgi:hypothetical protein